MFCKIAILDAGLTSTKAQPNTLSAAMWKGTRNGSTTRVTTFVAEDGVATIQLERIQDAFAIIRRVLLRVPVPGTNETMVALWRVGKGWTYTTRPATTPPVLFVGNPIKTMDVEPRPIAPGVEALRRMVVPCYKSEGQFLDWVAYKSPHGWAVDTIHDLTEDQARAILAGYGVLHV